MGVLIKKDLRKYLGKIKDQGNRPTCMAFTATDCHSFARGGKLDLSVAIPSPKM